MNPNTVMAFMIGGFACLGILIYLIMIVGFVFRYMGAGL